MRRISIVFVIAIIVITLSSCDKNDALPLTDPEIELFYLIYEEDDYSVFERIDFEEDKYFTMEGYKIEGDDYSCIVGSEDKFNYRFLYEENYYDIVEADKLNIFTCSDLIDIGIGLTITTD